MSRALTTTKACVLLVLGLCCCYLFVGSSGPLRTQQRHDDSLERLVRAQNETIKRLRAAIAAKKQASQISRGELNPGQDKTAPAPRIVDTPREGKVSTASQGAFAGHEILRVEETRTIGMDALMASYGAAQGPGCERDFGNGLVERWRGERKTFCEPKRVGDSKIECYLIRQTAHHGNGDNLCLATNARLNFKDFGGTMPAEYFERYVASRHRQQFSKLEYSKGTLAGTCDPSPSLWKKKFFPGWNVNWFNAFESVDDLACDVWEETPTLIVERDTFANFFHNSEDFFNTQLALAIFRWAIGDMQILITDIYPKGPFWPLWSRIFKGAKEPLTAFDIKKKYGDGKNVCFKQVAIGILGAAAPVTVASFNTKCSKVPLVRSYADLVIANLGLSNQTRYARAASVDPKRVVLTYMARRASSVWPEKRFCDSEQSFFKCDRLAHLGVRQVGRSTKNDADVVRSLKSLEGRSFKNGARLVVQDVDYALIDFETQILTDLDTDVMVGAHGAGLLHNIFMPDRAALVELFIDSSQANRHFHNFAKWHGHRYFSKPMINPIPTSDLIRLVTQAVESIDLSKPY